MAWMNCQAHLDCAIITATGDHMGATPGTAACVHKGCVTTKLAHTFSNLQVPQAKGLVCGGGD